jgi:hypothetical protein
MFDQDYERGNLEDIYKSASLSPVFKSNPKYNTGNTTPYISYSDILANRYIIRGKPLGNSNSFEGGERKIIAEYESIESLVKDGWRLG